MAYAPPFSAAIDSINAAAFVAENLCSDRLRKVDMDRFLAWMALDIRHPQEAGPFVEKFGKEKWLAVPYAEVRDRHGEVPGNKMKIILCDAGTRSYEVQIFLDHIGKKNTMVLSGGFNVARRIGVDWYPE